MARKVIVTEELTDDLDGGPANETIGFALDGVAYEIDLSAKNAKKLRDLLAPYVGGARKAGKSPARTRAKSSSPKRDLSEVREWAKAQGLKVNDRGRISAEVLEKFDSASKS